MLLVLGGLLMLMWEVLISSSLIVSHQSYIDVCLVMMTLKSVAICLHGKEVKTNWSYKYFLLVLQAYTWLGKGLSWILWYCFVTVCKAGTLYAFVVYLLYTKIKGRCRARCLHVFLYTRLFFVPTRPSGVKTFTTHVHVLFCGHIVLQTTEHIYRPPRHKILSKPLI